MPRSGDCLSYRTVLDEASAIGETWNVTLQNWKDTIETGRHLLLENLSVLVSHHHSQCCSQTVRKAVSKVPAKVSSCRAVKRFSIPEGQEFAKLLIKQNFLPEFCKSVDPILILQFVKLSTAHEVCTLDCYG